MNDRWQKIKEEKVYNGYRKIIKRHFILPDKRESEWDVSLDNDTVTIVALTKNNKVILTQQFRVGPEQLCLELPGGYIEKNEKPEETAKRELLEETGYAGDMEFIGTSLHDAYSTMTRYNYVVLNCIKVQEIEPEENEFIKVVKMDLKEFREFIKKGEMTDMGSAYLALDYLNKL